MRLKIIAAAVTLAALPACGTINGVTEKVGVAPIQNACANAETIPDRGFCVQRTYQSALETCVDLTAPADAEGRVIEACARGAETLTPVVGGLTTATLTYVDAKDLYESTLAAGGDGPLALTLLASVQEASQIAREAYTDAKPRVDAFLQSIEGEE